MIEEFIQGSRQTNLKTQHRWKKDVRRVVFFHGGNALSKYMGRLPRKIYTRHLLCPTASFRTKKQRIWYKWDAQHTRRQPKQIEMKEKRTWKNKRQEVTSLCEPTVCASFISYLSFLIKREIIIHKRREKTQIEKGGRIVNRQNELITETVGFTSFLYYNEISRWKGKLFGRAFVWLDGSRLVSQTVGQVVGRSQLGQMIMRRLWRINDAFCFVFFLFSLTNPHLLLLLRFFSRKQRKGRERKKGSRSSRTRFRSHAGVSCPCQAQRFHL